MRGVAKKVEVAHKNERVPHNLGSYPRVQEELFLNPIKCFSVIQFNFCHMHNISQSSTRSLQENHSKVKVLSLPDISCTSLTVLS